MKRRGLLGGLLASPLVGSAPMEVGYPEGLAKGSIRPPDPYDHVRNRLNDARYRKKRRIAENELHVWGAEIHGASHVPEYSPYASLKSVAPWKRLEMYTKNEERKRKYAEDAYISRLESMLTWPEKLLEEFTQAL